MEVSITFVLVHFVACGFGLLWVLSCRVVLIAQPLPGSDRTGEPFDVLGHQSGWVACFLVEVGPFFGVPKRAASSKVRLGSPFCQRSVAVLGVIADSEYVDCMGNNRTSTLYGTLVDLEY